MYTFIFPDSNGKTSNVSSFFKEGDSGLKYMYFTMLMEEKSMNSFLTFSFF